MSSKHRNNKKKKEVFQQTSSAAIRNVPASPFADYTNLHMLFQQQYPPAQFFMNPMNPMNSMNPTNPLISDKDISEIKEVINWFKL
jgi:hypothetical protein